MPVFSDYRIAHKRELSTYVLQSAGELLSLSFHSFFWLQRKGVALGDGFKGMFCKNDLGTLVTGTFGRRRTDARTSNQVGIAVPPSHVPSTPQPLNPSTRLGTPRIAKNGPLFEFEKGKKSAKAGWSPWICVQQRQTRQN